MQKQSGELSLPVAIIFSGIIIAGAILFTSDNRAVIQSAGVPVDSQAGQVSAALDKMQPISKDDHIRGNVDAPIKIVEYSDLECTFCARVHETLSAIVDEYDGEVAWVYRQFPLTNVAQNFHVNAERASQASECVADLGGNDAFWSFIDGIFASNLARTDTLFNNLAIDLGIDTEELSECIESGKYQTKVENSINDAFTTGGKGTPWMIVVGPNGEKFPISGAQPIEVFRPVIDNILG